MTDRDAVWDAESGGPKEPRLVSFQISPWEGAILRGKGHAPASPMTLP